MVRAMASRPALVGSCLLVLGLAGQAAPQTADHPGQAPPAEDRTGQAPHEAYGLPLRGAEAEAFLKTAKVVKKKALSIGVTHSEQLTLSDGSRTLRAVRKTIDERKHGVTSLEGGGFAVDFVDSWKYEVAAYELDKLLGLDLVPPTVERRLEGTNGSLQMWVEGTMDEADRAKKKLRPPDPQRWNDAVYTVRLLHALTLNTDSRNLHNELVDPAFQIYAIDFTRAFRPQDFLLAEKGLQRFSRSFLERMKALDRPTLDQALGPWLSGPEIQGLLRRRDRILALAETRVREKGEAAVLYP